MVFLLVLINFFVHFHVVVHSFLLLDGVKLPEDHDELENPAKEVILGLLVVVDKEASESNT